MIREFYPRIAGVQLTAFLPQSISVQHGHRECRKEVLEREQSGGRHGAGAVNEASPGQPIFDTGDACVIPDGASGA